MIELAAETTTPIGRMSGGVAPFASWCSSFEYPCAHFLSFIECGTSSCVPNHLTIPAVICYCPAAPIQHYYYHYQVHIVLSGIQYAGTLY